MTSPSDPTEEPTEEQPEQQPAEQAVEPESVEAVAEKPAATPARPRQRASRSRRAAPAEEAAATPTGNGAAPTENGSAPHPRLLDTYRNEIVPAMMSEFDFTNVMRVPRLQKVVLNIGLGEALTNGRAMESATRDLTIISGQKPIITRARKSIRQLQVARG